MLTLIGADVLLIQNQADIEVQADIKELSTEFILGTFGECNIPTYRKKEKNIQVEHNQRKRQREWKQQEHQGEVGQRGIEQQEMIKVRLPERRREGVNIPKGDPRNKQSEVEKISNIYEQSKTTDRKRKERTEKSFEELAQLASSVVMIAVHNKAGDVIATGSGIMISRNGYILTNHHVITDGYFYSIRIEEDEKMYQTDEVVKYHSVLDLAILRIDRKLNPIPIYKGSQKLVRGQKVVAIGSPLGLFNSVSDGIISGFRNIDGVDMIQFTAPTSHGSSGGAVLNMYGEVIGISTAGIDKGQNINLAVGYEGINLFVRGFEGL
ncbi:MAG TPA: trypsin-like peptidase domain-containing protein [Candidatus Scybalomonas excrementigallinarum]|nr:trypsin-like peptidase domain-containing protein [Candidatus Scybalomonas excrementigallinarum]